MTLADFLNLPAGIIAALAAILAAFISAFTVFLTALVNARTARVTSRDEFRRQLRLENLKPFFQAVDARLHTLNTFVDAVDVVLRAEERYEPEDEAVSRAHDDLDSRIRDFQIAMKGFEDSTISRGTAVRAFVSRDPRLERMFDDWMDAYYDAHDSLIEDGIFGLSGRAQLDKMRRAAVELRSFTIDLRVALEDAVTNPAAGRFSRMTQRVTMKVRAAARPSKVEPVTRTAETEAGNQNSTGESAGR